MSLRWWKATSGMLVLSLFISSCGSGIFAGDAGVQQAAQDALPKPPLAITKGSSDPIPAINAEDYKPPKPPVRPFSVSAALFPETAAANAQPDALLVGAAPAVVTSSSSSGQGGSLALPRRTGAERAAGQRRLLTSDIGGNHGFPISEIAAADDRR